VIFGGVQFDGFRKIMKNAIYNELLAGLNRMKKDGIARM
jgi:hypothetical protein